MLRKLILILVVLIYFAAPTQAITLDGIVAVVNDNAITLSDLDIEMWLREIRGEQSDRGDALEALIEREIVSREAFRLGISATQDEIDAEIYKTRESIGSEEKLVILLSRIGLTIQNLSRIFASRIVVQKMKIHKDSIGSGRYEKWFMDVKKRANIVKPQKNN